jgi:ABC-type transporter Mla MlaB component
MFARQACDNEFSTLIWHLSTVAKLQSAGVSVTALLIRGADEYATDRRRGAWQQSAK